MFHGRRRIQNRYNPNRVKKGGRFKLVVLLVVFVAVVSAVITSLLLGGKAEKSKLDSYGRHNLTAFGGTEEPAEDYGALRDVQAYFVDIHGMDKGDFRNSVSALDGGNAVAVKVNDSEGNLFVSFESVTAEANITPADIADVAADDGRISVAYFYSSALFEEKASDVALKIGEEIALVTELAEGGINEIALFGIKAFDDMEYVRSYLSLAEAACEITNICVVLDGEALENADPARIISATEGYADAYALDMSGVENAELGETIEKCAYFITNYNARVLVLDADDVEKVSETIAILESYGIKSYELVK